MATSNSTVPPFPNEDRGPGLVASVVVFFVITAIVYGFRVWCRLRPKYAMTAADYIITLAMILKGASMVFVILMVKHDFGKHNFYIPQENMIPIQGYMLGVFMTGIAASGFARISVATLLFRFTTNRGCRIVLWTIIGFQLLNITSYQIVQLVQCRTVMSATNTFQQAQCLTKMQVLTFTYFQVAVCTASDLICTALPIFLVWRLSRSVVEKILVITLIATCLLATVCAVPKLHFLLVYEFKGKDQMWQLVPEILWCRLEESFIIIAACLPLLKQPIERVLRGLKLVDFEGRPRDIDRISTAVDASRSVGAWPDEGARHFTLPNDEEVGSKAKTEGVGSTSESTTTKSIAEVDRR